MLATSGVAVLSVGFLLTLINALWSTRHGAPAGDNPWGAGTLEWATASPPAPYNHRNIPVVESRTPVWDWRGREERPVVGGLRHDRRAVVVTLALDAEPSVVEVLPKPAPWPFVSAVMASIGFIGILIDPIFFVVGFFLVFFTYVAWFWPRRPWRED